MQLPNEFVLPDYDGTTIANMPATVAQWFDVPFAGLPPMPRSHWKPVDGGVKRVVVLLIDALGWNLINLLRDEIACLNSAEICQPITSVFPSTTANALSSVWTGTAPAQHGLVGFKLFLKEYGTVAQMIGLSPAFMGIGARDVLADAGMEPEAFLATLGSAEQFSASDVAVHDFKGAQIVDSALSKMHGRGVASRNGVLSFADMLAQASTMLESVPPNQRAYLHLYWPSIDMLSHRHGPFGASTLAEARALFGQLQAGLLDNLSPAAREGTLVCLMADHGHITYDKSQAILLSQHPELNAMLLMPPSGGVRFPYLYAKQGMVQAVIDYVNRHLGELALPISAEKAFDLNLFGPKPYAKYARDRVGDVVLLMRDHATFIEPREEPFVREIVAGHGGLSADEMESPWIVWRLG